jgi:hypothetical protein
MSARGLAVALLFPLVLLSACGGDSGSTAADPVGSDSTSAAPTESSTPSETASEATSSAPATPDWPACSDVWTADADLPGGYKGCLEGDTAVPADGLMCSSGQRIVRYDEQFFAVPGGTIYQATGPLEKDKQYLKMVRVCRA